MLIQQREQIKETLVQLHKDSNYDHLRMMKNVAKSIFKPMQPSDFKDVYLSISREQGEDLKRLVTENGIKKIVEFGTSFGISTLYLALGAVETEGHIVTTELIESKAQKAIENFKRAGVNHLIEVKVGDALQTLRNHNEPIDLLLLDGWKNLYLAIFQMLEPNFHPNTFIYVDNADMAETQAFLRAVSHNSRYQLQPKYQGKVVLISIRP